MMHSFHFEPPTYFVILRDILRPIYEYWQCGMPRLTIPQEGVMYLPESCLLQNWLTIDNVLHYFKLIFSVTQVNFSTIELNNLRLRKLKRKKPITPLKLVGFDVCAVLHSPCFLYLACPHPTKECPHIPLSNSVLI